MSSTVERLKQYGEIPAALIFLAQEIDKLKAPGHSALELEWEMPAGGLAHGEHPVDYNSWPTDDHDITDDPDLTDVEKQKALVARRRLREEAGSTKTERPEPKVRVEIGGHADAVEVPPATGDQLMKRRAFVDTLFQGHKLYDTKEIKEAFVIGGPIWLHAYDRAFVMSLPIEWRRQMVEDVEQTGTREAQDLGADILKHGGPEDDNPSFAPDLAQFEGAE